MDENKLVGRNKKRTRTICKNSSNKLFRPRFQEDRTINNMKPLLLLEIAVDLGIQTPGFLPSRTTFINEIKSDYIIFGKKERFECVPGIYGILCFIL